MRTLSSGASDIIDGVHHALNNILEREPMDSGLENPGLNPACCIIIKYLIFMTLCYLIYKINIRLAVGCNVDI